MQSILQPILGPHKEIHDLTGRVALITGGALGIGYEIARAFVLNGAKVYMTNRKEEQGQAAIEQIKKEAGENAQIEWFPCDMGNLNEIKEVFEDFRKKEDRLDLLILSAGINVNQYGETHDHIDRHFEVNWLGQFYVVNLVYPLLRKTSKLPNTPAPRIVFETSEQHRMAPKNVHFATLEEINNPEVGNLELYGRTKLAIILGVKYGLLDRVIKPNNDNIYALSVHPGAVNTAMQQQWKDAYPGLLGKLLTTVMLAAGRTPEHGSFSALYAATSPEVEEKGWNGYYFSDPAQPGKESAQASDPSLGAALWDLSHRIIKEKLLECSSILQVSFDGVISYCECRSIIIPENLTFSPSIYIFSISMSILPTNSDHPPKVSICSTGTILFPPDLISQVSPMLLHQSPSRGMHRSAVPARCRPPSGPPVSACNDPGHHGNWSLLAKSRAEAISGNEGSLAQV
ncbi:uncharacterized protein An09g01150 [Aspergillus niger]|uniref:Contig An09c0040, genomic contig n=2 Tax=Aspergillus niger TaxID=5061 RepID=A2QT81_ASPNC|nr:uncharacterized protein An09g01150 [Aspergillus niger]CAK49037.1 unnamed protein product [Aspergillus niger]